MQGFVGNLTGEAALHHMSSWRRVYFTFSLMSTLPSSPASKQASTTPLPPLPSSNHPSSGSSVRLAPQSGPLPPSTPSSTGPLGTTTGPLGHQNGYDVATLVPYRLSQQADVMSLSLNRLQRSVYLLVDGQRSVADLARFTGKRIPDILQTLVELRARNLVNM